MTSFRQSENAIVLKSKD